MYLYTWHNQPLFGTNVCVLVLVYCIVTHVKTIHCGMFSGKKINQHTLVNKTGGN